MRKLRRSHPQAPLAGTVEVPGDKSISHRALIVAGLARGRSNLTGLNSGADVQATVRLVAQLGAGVEFDRDNLKVRVQGYGWEGLDEPDDVLFAGNSGTTMRCLLGVCSAVEGLSVLAGDHSLGRRPMLRVVAPLRQMGATIDGRRHGELPPLVVRGGELQGLDHESQVASAQVKTALLLAGMRAAGTTSVTEPSASRDHTERLLQATGVDLEWSGTTVALEGGQAPGPFNLAIPGDFSAAAFLIGAAVLLESSEVTITGVGLNPTRTRFLDVLGAMGAEITADVTEQRLGEPVGRISARASELTAIEIGGHDTASFIDELPLLAVLATQADGRTVVKDARELRVKESDRIEAMVTGLNALGASARATQDGFEIAGPTPLLGGEVDSRMDHRVALSFAVAGLIAETNVRIRGWSSIEISFPEFLDTLAAARGST
ncbi:MAG: 3-phosphoshikimate 1-carboxyvinyltransferase [Actinomycetota bacterium]|nr:3-phosphoshikimate 1-carboxyvinyltransferase [Actinomycetota bacterium]